MTLAIIILAIIILVAAILAVLLVNEIGLDGTTARILRLVIIAAALIYLLAHLGV